MSLHPYMLLYMYMIVNAYVKKCFQVDLGGYHISRYCKSFAPTFKSLHMLIGFPASPGHNAIYPWEHWEGLPDMQGGGCYPGIADVKWCQSIDSRKIRRKLCFCGTENYVFLWDSSNQFWEGGKLIHIELPLIGLSHASMVQETSY